MTKFVKNSLFLLIAVFFLLASDCYAKENHAYQTFHPMTKKVVQNFQSSMIKLNNGDYKISWVLREKDKEIIEKYTLNSEFETKTWKVKSLKDDTDYLGEYKDETIKILGRFKGKPIKKTLKVPNHPFYVNPKFGLRNFILSDQKKIKFWGLRNDELSRHLMVATKRGEEAIIINGLSVKTIKIHWTVSGVGSLFFERYYWFRKSDGLYVRQKVGNDLIREIVELNNE
jgi:hypothetical protein